MTKRQTILYVAILLLVTNLTTAAVVYGLLYSVPASAEAPRPQSAGGPILPKPELEIPARREPNVAAPRDPLKVLDPDAAYWDQQNEVMKLKWAWVLTEIVTLQDGFGGVQLGARFKSDSRIYKEGDRLPGMHFTLKSIHEDGESAFVEVEGDLGIRVKLNMDR